MAVTLREQATQTDRSYPTQEAEAAALAESLKQVEELARRHEKSQRARGRLKSVLRASLSVNVIKDATQEALAEEMERSRARAGARGGGANAAEEAARGTEAKRVSRSDGKGHRGGGAPCRA